VTAVWSEQADALARADYLRDLAALLWPAPAAVAIGRAGAAAPARRGGPTAHNPHGEHTGDREQYLIVPHARHPRLLIPAGRLAAATAVTGFHPGRSRRARLLSHGLATALRTGAAHAILRDRLTVTGAADTFGRYLSGVLGSELAIAVHIGPARANRKPVAQLIDGAGGTAGYAKMGAGELTRRLVRAEEAALRLLGGIALATVRVPTIRHHGQWRGAEILVLDPLPTRRATRPAGAALRSAAMLEIAASCGLRRHPLSAGAYLHDLRRGLAALGERGAPFARGLEEIAARAGDTALAFGAWHGDWTRWNMAPHGGTLLAWDWERFATGVPVGFDALHYQVQDAITAGHLPPAEAVRVTFSAAAQIVQPFGSLDGFSYGGVIGQRTARLTAALYLIEIGRRYLADRQDEAGAHLGRAADWLLPGLTSAIGAL
jgi:hypothetical protein